MEASSDCWGGETYIGCAPGVGPCQTSRSQGSALGEAAPAAEWQSSATRHFNTTTLNLSHFLSISKCWLYISWMYTDKILVLLRKVNKSIQCLSKIFWSLCCQSWLDLSVLKREADPSLPFPPPMAQIFIHLFTPLFLFCNWLPHRWNWFYTWSESKISLLKIDIDQQLQPLTANYLSMFKVTSTTIYT